MWLSMPTSQSNLPTLVSTPSTKISTVLQFLLSAQVLRSSYTCEKFEMGLLQISQDSIVSSLSSKKGKDSLRWGWYLTKLQKS